MYPYCMKETIDLPFKVRSYIDEVIQLADKRSPAIVSVAIFGSVAKGGFSESISDVDLIIALADEVPQKTKRMINSELAALELKHKLRERPKT